MIVCVCNRINCKGVREAVESGAATPRDVQAHHGCRFNCGKCSNLIGDMICESRLAEAGGRAAAE